MKKFAHALSPVEFQNRDAPNQFWNLWLVVCVGHPCYNVLVIQYGTATYVPGNLTKIINYYQRITE